MLINNNTFGEKITNVSQNALLGPPKNTLRTHVARLLPTLTPGQTPGLGRYRLRLHQYNKYPCLDISNIVQYIVSCWKNGHSARW